MNIKYYRYIYLVNIFVFKIKNVVEYTNILQYMYTL